MSLNNTSGMVMRKIANRFSDKKKPTRVEKPRQFIGAVVGAVADYAWDYGTTTAITGEALSAPSKNSDVGGGVDFLFGEENLQDAFVKGSTIIGNAYIDTATDVGNTVIDFATDVGIVDGVKTGVSTVADFTNDVIDNPEKVGNDALKIGENIVNDTVDFGEDALEIGENIVNDAVDIGKDALDFGKEALNVGGDVVNNIGDALGLGSTPVVELKGVNTIDDVYNLIANVNSNSLGGLGTTGQNEAAKEKQDGMDAKQAIDFIEGLDGAAPPSSGAVDDGNGLSPEELGLIAVSNYKFEKLSEDKVNEITDVAKNIFGGTTSNTSDTSSTNIVATTDLLNTIGALLTNTTTTNSKAIESIERAFTDAITKKENTSTAFEQAENAVKQAQFDLDKETGYYAKIQKKQKLDEAEKALQTAAAAKTAAENTADAASTNNEIAQAAIVAKEKTENNTRVLRTVAAAVVNQTNATNALTNTLTKTNNKVASLEDSISNLKSQIAKKF